MIAVVLNAKQSRAVFLVGMPSRRKAGYEGNANNRKHAMAEVKHGPQLNPGPACFARAFLESDVLRFGQSFKLRLSE